MLDHWGEKGRYSLGIWYSFREDFRDRLFNFPDTVEAEICSQTCHVFGIRPSPFLSLFLLPPHPLHQFCGQAPCWQQSVLPYERAAFDFPQSLSPHFPSWSLAEPLAVPVQHSKPSKAWDEPVWFIMEHNSFEVYI